MTWNLITDTMMEENYQVVIENWTDWKTSFFKTIANFLAIAIQILFWHKRDNQKLFDGTDWMDYHCTCWWISTNTGTIDFIFVFSAESEWQYLGILKLFADFGVSSMWNFGTMCSSKSIFERYLYFIDPRRTKIMRKNWFLKNLEETFNHFTFKFKSSLFSAF